MASPRKPARPLVAMTIYVPEQALPTLDRQGRARGLSRTQWAGQLFDAGFAAACAREKSMPVLDSDLDAILGATLLLRAREGWDVPALAKALGVPEATIERILDGWSDYRRASL
ncbi:hypothetical protein BJF92_11205 [Rhizobium rhizosphaerae]|uniref:Uncharacterized protein n=1 Tax=Xaviernesmea rhizosphaerae TaxID=1672749 RepID=A0A1Q9AMP6_9HYPH|nr:helix-turn-helix domain-containing protein [Xaviernesmea rhizosphaerae]OLP56651.1 hypothetical protein BJF92_11205 [Xaviernesmea rhizosphaerae]